MSVKTPILHPVKIYSERSVINNFKLITETDKQYVSIKIRLHLIFNTIQIEYYCPYWGSESLSYEAFCMKVETAGYDGVEIYLPFRDASKKAALIAAIVCYPLRLILQHNQTTEPNFDAQRHLLRDYLEDLMDLDCVLINSQTGKDYFKKEQNQELIEMASEIGAHTGRKIIRETHRGKFSFDLGVTKCYLEALPDLRLTLDISHWTNVSESLLEAQEEALELAITRTNHIHSRIGFQEMPQIPDPRAPEWKGVVDRHVSIWQRVVNFKKKAGHPL